MTGGIIVLFSSAAIGAGDIVDSLFSYIYSIDDIDPLARNLLI